VAADEVRPGGVLGVIGDVVEDVVVLMRAPFAAGSDTPSHIVRRRGGSAANVAEAAYALVPTRFFGCVGDDDAGRRLARDLKAFAHLQVTNRATTGAIVVLVDANGERHMFPDRGANLWLESIEDAPLQDLAALHVTAYSLQGGVTADTVTSAMTRVSEWGGVTSLDVSSAALITQIGAGRLLEIIGEMRPTILMANEAEAALLGWDVLGASPNPSLVIVKRGARPALVRTPLGAWEVPTTPLNVTDTTGAGDAFAAGVLAHVITKGLTAQALLAGDESLAVALAQAGHRRAAVRVAATSRLSR